ncbi:hypothetical protein MYAM1_000017 [Malassezia yamatoensis]|uniref:START domain-containing protein n=1 Tax=Malassezia yamatoensis TaxID=253288 RepID=A0AAJ5YPD2_9BASI|nr:hypothetical protein MYAM1_000017 [Malassezia yamatoensis]
MLHGWESCIEQAIDSLVDLHTNSVSRKPWHEVLTTQQEVGTPEKSDDGNNKDCDTDWTGADASPKVAMLPQGLGGKDVYRATWSLQRNEPKTTLNEAHAVLQNVSRVSTWMPVVESAELLQVLGPHYAVIKTRFKLGWPTSPRDAVLLTYLEASEDLLLFVATSVPRNLESVAFLRPSPPYVRANVHLSALVLQRVGTDHISLASYWSWDLHGALLGVRTNAMGTYFPRQLPSLISFTTQQGKELPLLGGYGVGIEIELVDSQSTLLKDKHTMEILYTVHKPIGGRGGNTQSVEPLKVDHVKFGPDPGMDQGTLRWFLGSSQGWTMEVDVQNVNQTQAVNRSNERRWIASVVQIRSQYEVRLQHECAMRVRVTVYSTTDHEGVVINEQPQEVLVDAAQTHLQDQVPVWMDRIAEVKRVPTALSLPTTNQARRQSKSEPDAKGVAQPSANLDEGGGREMSCGTPPTPTWKPLASLVRRNYIYFTSLLQEPEAKWKAVSDLRGVTVTQLDSIDPTLVVYRAEATFVGLSVWDFFSTLNFPELAQVWDKSVGEAQLVRDIGAQSSVWHLNKRGSWTTNARDAVLVQTAYTAPGSIHLFAFSIDAHTMPGLEVPDVRSGTIRSQVDLRGWSMEALSPTTVHVTLIEQSDPGGWMSKSSLPAQMIQSMASAGEYTIRHGGPPVMTRLLHARATQCSYAHETNTYTLRYKPVMQELEQDALVECEIRCSMEAWAPNVDVAVSPAPQNIACLHRHKLSLGGGGLWLTLEHSSSQVSAGQEIEVIIRKGPAQSKERNVVLVNGTRMHVDVDDLDAAQIQALSKRKRTKPQRVPLLFEQRVSSEARNEKGVARNETQLEILADAEEGEAQESVKSGGLPREVKGGVKRDSMQSALDAMFLLRRINSERHPDPSGMPAGWELVSERGGMFVRRKLLESLSATVAVQRADKIVQGIDAEELARLVSNLGCRSLWDERMESTKQLASFGSGANIACWTSKASFPFRPRMFVVSSLSAFGSGVGSLGQSAGTLSPGGASQPVYFHVSASCDAEVDMGHINPQQYPMGKVLIDGWIFETLDPYTSAQFPIPSTRATHVVAVDYGGSMPATINHVWNAGLPRALIQLEKFLKRRGPPPSLFLPPSWMQVVGDGHDDDRTLVWTLQRPRRPVLLLSSDFHASQGGYDVYAVIPAQDLVASCEANVPPLPLMESSMSPPSPSHTLHRSASRTLRKHDDQSSGMLLVELQLELQHYPQGYALEVTWTDAPLQDWGHPSVYDLGVQPDRLPNAAFPLQVRVLDRPPSALQAATRDAVDRSHKHLVQIHLSVLTDGTANSSKVEKELTTSVTRSSPSKRDSPLSWQDQLQECGKMVHITARPLSKAWNQVRASDTGQVPVTYNGNVAEIVYGEEANRFATSSENNTQLDQLERVSRSVALTPSTPKQPANTWTRTIDQDVLRQPIAASRSFYQHTNPSQEKLPLDKNTMSKDLFSDQHVDHTINTSAPAQSRSLLFSNNGLNESKKDTSAGNAPAPMFGLLRTNQALNSTLNSVTNLVSYVHPKPAEEAAATADTAGTAGIAATPSTSSAAPSPSPMQAPGHWNREVSSFQPSLHRGLPRHRRSTLVLVAIVSFLLGSLMRSLLQPTDFVLIHCVDQSATYQENSVSSSARDYQPNFYGMPASEVQQFMQTAREWNGLEPRIQGKDSTEATTGIEDEEMIGWRKMRRLLQTRVARKYDLMVAIVNR